MIDVLRWIAGIIVLAIGFLAFFGTAFMKLKPKQKRRGPVVLSVILLMVGIAIIPSAKTQSAKLAPPPNATKSISSNVSKSNTTKTVNTTVKTTSTTKRDASKNQQTISSDCRSVPLAGVYHPYRLQVISACKTVSGTVVAIRHEADHDYHINLKLDSQYASLINSKNIEYEHGDIVAEVIPMDQHDVPVPTVGEHITVTGAYAKDADHGWMEMHPVWFVNGKGSSAYTQTAAAASVQTGVCGNHDSDCKTSQSKSTSSSPPKSSSTTSASTSSEISIVSSTLAVADGNEASITIHTTPDASGTIEVDYESGASRATGLYPQTADNNGDITWTWKVGTRTTPGNWPVIITIGSKTLQTTVNVSR